MNLTTQQTFLAVLGGLVLFFATATLAGNWLTDRAATALAGDSRLKQPWVRQLNSRIRASWLIVLLFAAAFALGNWALVLIFALASFFALREFVALTPIKASDNWALVLAFYVVIPLQYLLVLTEWYGLYAVLIPVYLFLLLPVVMAWKMDTELYLQRVAKVQWGVMLSVYCVSHAPAIATLEPPGHEGRGPLLLLYFLLVVQSSDIFAVIASALLGRTPLRSDHNKSREGVLLGGGAAILLGTALWWLTPFAWWQAALIATLTVVAGFMGGLVLASVKRSLGERDWGGDVAYLSRGVLERLAALTFAAPVFFHATAYFFFRP
jgi:phosphatidate cytidylyltransferase